MRPLRELHAGPLDMQSLQKKAPAFGGGKARKTAMTVRLIAYIWLPWVSRLSVLSLFFTVVVATVVGGIFPHRH